MILSVRQDFTQCHFVISVCLHTNSRMMKGTMREQEMNEMKKKCFNDVSIGTNFDAISCASVPQLHN